MKRSFQARMSLAGLGVALILLCGCVMNSQELFPANEQQSSVEEEDLSEYTSDLLQCVTNEFIKYKGLDHPYRLVTIDISDFEDFSIEKYEKWVEESYADEDLVVVVFTDKDDVYESDSDAEEYLQKNGYDNYESFPDDWDWTSIRITRRTEEETIQPKEQLFVALSYRTIDEREGCEVKLKYDDEEWAVTKTEWDYNS